MIRIFVLIQYIYLNEHIRSQKYDFHIMIIFQVDYNHSLISIQNHEFYEELLMLLLDSLKDLIHEVEFPQYIQLFYIQ